MSEKSWLKNQLDQIDDKPIVYDPATKGFSKLERWQPIESAPRDGEQFLVTDGEFVVMAEHPNDDIIIHDITSCGMGIITHWMHLPEPPTNPNPKTEE